MKSNEEILKERASQLAIKKNETIDFEERLLNVVAFDLSYERYGIDNQLITEVLLLKELTPIPGAPAFISGVTNVRGKIVSIVNLKVFLGLVTKGITEFNKAIILSHNGMEFGIITDAICGTLKISENLLSKPPATLKGKGAEFIKGITPDGMIILDGERLLSDHGILVNQK